MKTRIDEAEVGRSDRGNYSEYARFLLEETQAAAIVLVVVGGERGSGTAVVCEEAELPPAVLARILQRVADGIQSGPGIGPTYHAAG